MSKEGVPIEHFDPKPAIKKNAEFAHDWEYSEEAQFLYGMAVLFRDRFLDPILHPDRGRLPDPVISFDDLRNKKTLAAYTLHRNPQGLLDEITFNTVHYVEKDGKKVWAFGRWAQLETLLHEQVHLWQENFGENKHKPGRVMHDKEFVEKCRSLGLYPLPVIGSHFQVADRPFAEIMKELGLPRPSDVPRAEGEKPRKRDWFRPRPESGRSTLHKWECPNCGLALRVGIKGDINSTHDDCGVKYIRADAKDKTIYKANALLDSANYRAQEAILSSVLPEEKKDEILEDSIGTIQQVAERKAAYFAKNGEGRRTRRPKKSMKEGEPKPPTLFDQINEYLRKEAPKDIENPTVEGIAGGMGISEDVLHHWLNHDGQFKEEMTRLKEFQINDPFKEGTEFDYFIHSSGVQFVLDETKKRYSA